MMTIEQILKAIIVLVIFGLIAWTITATGASYESRWTALAIAIGLGIGVGLFRFAKSRM